MLVERRRSKTKESKETTNLPSTWNSSTIGENSAGATARSCPSEAKLRCPYYCEENVWRLAYRRLHGDSSKNQNENSVGKENEEYHVVFISNQEKCCPMLYQKASKDPTAAVFWDYHVILIRTTKVVRKGKSEKEVIVLDVDTSLPYPCALQEYLDASFGEIQFPNVEAKNKYQPIFRVVRADQYLQNFKSDRSHMKREDGTWTVPPPTYDCITPSSGNDPSDCSNLKDYTNMKKGKKRSSVFGEVLTMSQLLSKFYPARR